jgi:hypothetical protein
MNEYPGNLLCFENEVILNLKLSSFLPYKHGNYRIPPYHSFFIHTPQIVEKSDTVLLGKLHSKAIIHLCI